MKNPYLNAVDFPYVLLDTYKRIGLSEKEMITVLMIDHLVEQGNSFINGDMLSLKMNLKPNEIDSVMTDLINKNYISYDTVKGKLAISISNLKEKAFLCFKEMMDSEQTKITDKGREEALTELHEFFESRLNRTLTPLESSTLNEWLDTRYSVDEIKNALLNTIKTGKKSIRAVKNTLKNARKENDILKEGGSAINENWDKDIEETMAIMKDLWGN